MIVSIEQIPIIEGALKTTMDAAIRESDMATLASALSAAVALHRLAARLIRETSLHESHSVNLVAISDLFGAIDLFFASDEISISAVGLRLLMDVASIHRTHYDRHESIISQMLSNTDLNIRLNVCIYSILF